VIRVSWHDVDELVWLQRERSQLGKRDERVGIAKERTYEIFQKGLA